MGFCSGQHLEDYIAVLDIVDTYSFGQVISHKDRPSFWLTNRLRTKFTERYISAAAPENAMRESSIKNLDLFA